MKRKSEGFKKYFHFKTNYRLGMLAYWLSVFLISPKFLYLLIPYSVFRLYTFLESESRYDDWKWRKYAESDQKLTFRKLHYIIHKHQDLALSDEPMKRYVSGTFKKGVLKVDNHLRIELTYDNDNMRYESTLYFQNERVGTISGSSSEEIKWGIDEYPEIKKILTKFMNQLQEQFQEAEKKKKKRETKQETAKREAEEQRKKELAKRIKQTYKKDMSI